MNAFLTAYRAETWRRPLRKLKAIYRGIKHSYQRVVRGYSDSDSWDISRWFLGIAPKIIRQLAQETNGYPSGFSYGEWKALLVYMSYLFAHSDPDEPISERRVECQQEADANLKEAFELFEKYFRHMWW